MFSIRLQDLPPVQTCIVAVAALLCLTFLYCYREHQKTKRERNHQLSNLRIELALPDDVVIEADDRKRRVKMYPAIPQDASPTEGWRPSVWRAEFPSECDSLPRSPAMEKRRLGKKQPPWRRPS
jgi:hypothetical protein